MLAKILIALAAIIVVFAVIVFMQPSSFRIARSATIAAPAAAVFGQVNDLHKWEAWSPWAKKDPNAKTSYEGPPAGVGAVFAWNGNNEVGEGRMTITESKPDELVKFRLDFARPMKGTSASEFALKPEGGGTMVTWTMSGENGFAGKAFSLFMDCDKMVGGEFEKGLRDLKSVVEGPAGK